MRGLILAVALSCSLALPAVSLAAQEPVESSRVPARLTLAEALRIAEAASPVMAGARASVAMARSEVIGARERPNPTVEVESRGFPLFESNRPAFLDHQELTVAVSQELEPGGRRRWLREVADLGVQVASAQGTDVLRRLRLDVQRAYVQAALAKADSEAARATLDDIDRVVAINRARLEQGELSGIEMRRLQVERHRSADEALVAELAVRQARSRLLALLGSQSLDQEFDTVDPLADLPLGASGPPAGPADALENRPDLAALRLSEQRAGADAGLQRSLRIPPVSFGAGWQRDFGTNAVVVRATVGLPLWNRNESGRARAAAEQRLATGLTALAATSVALEVQLAADAVASNRRRVSSIATDYVRAAREARDIVLASYRAGAATLIDYLDAQRTLRDAQRAENRAWFDYRVSSFELEAALGGAPGRRP